MIARNGEREIPAVAWPAYVADATRGRTVFNAGGCPSCHASVDQDDRTVLGGLNYTYHVMAYDSSGRHSPPSNSVTVALPMPDFSDPVPAEASDA